MQILRFTTAGSVDDGKSTLIGRLLYDSKSIFEDQYAELETSSKKRGIEHVDLSLLTDGLKDEREQGITIDVAYRYFATPKRKFIIADTPGHIQYTRNMVTGASTANAAIILVDARNGLTEQSHRHLVISSLLGIQHIILAVNKMDLVDYSEERYQEIIQQFSDFIQKLEIKDYRFIPISALFGDNVVDRSEKMDWYKGETLLYTLEHLHVGSDHNAIDARFPVQTVIRPKSDQYHDFRGYAGRMASGALQKGDAVIVHPSGFTSSIKSIWKYETEVERAETSESVTIELQDDIDISRGDIIVRENNQPELQQQISAMVCWLDNTPLATRKKYILRHTTSEVQAMVTGIDYELDINTLHRKEAEQIGANSIAKINIKTAKPIATDDYTRNRITGSAVLVDPATNATVGALMIR